MIEVNQHRILDNVALFQEQNPDCAIIPVLKGNAYGHGLVQVAQILKHSSCSMVAVDGYFEAAAIRRICKQRILVMGYIAPENVHLVDTKRCSFVVQDTAGLEAFGKLGKTVRIHLELNTGMNRLGIEFGDVTNMLHFLRKYPQLELEGIMTHLADADNPNNSAYNEKQLHEFEAGVQKVLLRPFSPQLIHIAQTAGSTKIRSLYASEDWHRRNRLA